MPQAVGGFIGWIVGAAFEGLVAIGLSEAAAIFVVDAGIKLAGLAVLGNLAEKLVDIPDVSQTATENLVTTRGTIEHQRLIYGECLVSGPLWYMNSAGSHNQALYHAVVVAGHEVEDITDIWLDDNVILDASIDWAGDGSVDSYWPRGDTSLATTAYFDKKLGFETQAAQTDLVATFSEITTDHKGRGIAYFVARLDYFEGQTQVWSAGVPRAFRALVKGKKVYDPRSDSTQSFGTGPHRVTDDSTWEWSDNPALCWADYMIDSQHGFGEVSSRIDYGYVASAAEWCDDTVPLPDDPGPGGTDKRYRCNGTLSAGNTHKGNLESILSSANMTMALVQGQWKLRPFMFETPTLQFTDDDLRGDLQIKLTTQETERYNAVRGVFVDKDRQYQPHTFPTFVSTEYIWRDNSETLIRDIQLPMTNDLFMAQRLAAGILEQSDLQTTVIYPSNFKTLPVEIGGTIAITNSKMGWSEKPFRVTNYKLSDMKGIDLVLREDVAAAYADVGTAEYLVTSGGVYTTADPGVPPPTSFYTVNIPNGVELNWTNPPARLFEWIEIHRSTTNSFGGSSVVQIGETRLNHWEGNPPQGQLYYYWVRARNWAGEVSSPAPHQYSGQVGVYGDDGSLVIISDPSFEQTPINSTDDPAERFWTPMNTVGLNGSFGYGHTVVRSIGAVGNYGGSHVFEAGYKTQASSLGPSQFGPFNRKTVPFMRGMGMGVQCRYRVTTYTNVQSVFIDLNLSGKKSLYEAGGPDAKTFRITITNSIGWTIFSDFVSAAAMANVGSYSYVYADIEVRNHQDGTTTNTPAFCIQLDDYSMRWETP
jgi:hypothetical protein